MTYIITNEDFNIDYNLVVLSRELACGMASLTYYPLMIMLTGLAYYRHRKLYNENVLQPVLFNELVKFNFPDNKVQQRQAIKKQLERLTVSYERIFITTKNGKIRVFDEFIKHEGGYYFSFHSDIKKHMRKGIFDIKGDLTFFKLRDLKNLPPPAIKLFIFLCAYNSRFMDQASIPVEEIERTFNIKYEKINTDIFKKNIDILIEKQILQRASVEYEKKERKITHVIITCKAGKLFNEKPRLSEPPTISRQFV